MEFGSDRSICLVLLLMTLSLVDRDPFFFYEIDERRDFANDGLSVREEGFLSPYLTFFTRFALVHQPDIGGLPDDALGVELIDASDAVDMHDFFDAGLLALQSTLLA